MNLTDEELSECNKKVVKDPLFAKLVEFYKTVNESPFLEGYLTVYRQIHTWNEEIKNSSGKIKIVQDIGSDKDGRPVVTLDKSFDNAHKYLKEITILYEKLEWFRTHLTEKELALAEKEIAKMDKKKGTQVVV